MPITQPARSTINQPARQQQLPPQVLPSLVQLGRLPCGAPEATGVHVPRLPLKSHAWHEPVQAVSQQ